VNLNIFLLDGVIAEQEVDHIWHLTEGQIDKLSLLSRGRNSLFVKLKHNFN